MDFEKPIRRIVSTVAVPGYTLAPETIPIAIGALEEVDAKYGPNSENPLLYHNAPHSLGVMRRIVRLTNMLYPYIQPRHREHIFDMGLIVGGKHDVEQLLPGLGQNELASAVSAVSSIEEFDGPLNTPGFKDGVRLGILATTVLRLENDELVQINLQSGKQHPIKFIAGFCDINGIAMEGSKRMWQDATNYYFEITKEPSIEGLLRFYGGQAQFLSRRLNDGRVKADIAYSCPYNIEDVFSVMKHAFHDNIAFAHKLAVYINEHPELKIPADLTGRIIDKTVLGRVLGNMLIRKMSAGTSSSAS